MRGFSRFALLLANLRYFRAANLAVIAGMAVAAAVLTGALMVGDSVKGSLRDLALRRLDFVDHAMMSPRFIERGFARRLAETPEFKRRFESITPGIALRGSAAGEDGRGRVAGVRIGALADRYPVKPGQAVINPTLAGVIGAGGARFSLPAPDEAPRDSALARRSRADTIATFSVERSRIAPAGGFLDLFDLAGGQRSGPAAWVNLQSLQDELDRSDQVNLFLVHARSGHALPADAAALNGLISKVATLEDYGLETQPSDDRSQTVIGSKSTYIAPAIDAAAQKLARERGIALQRVSVYLVNNVVVEKREAGSGKREGGEAKPVIHYALAAGMDDLGAGEALAADEIAVNQWTADQLGLKIGDRLRLDYYLRQANGDLAEVKSDRPGVGLTFKLARILPMNGIGADATLTPTYKGLTDADTIADWRPPLGLTIDKKLVTKDDEAYWSRYKGAPKLFINLQSAEKLWGSAFGEVTSLRVPAAKGKAFTEALARRIDPAALGMVFRPIRYQQLQASSGSTDFAELFIGFSFFLLIAAVMLVAMLFRLSIEQRSRQLGLLSACGFAPSPLRRLCLKEGMLLALVGAGLGIGMAFGYTAIIMYGLRTWWIGAIGTTALRLHIVPLTPVYGFLGSVLAAFFTIWWAVGRVGKTPPAALLAGALGRSAMRAGGTPAAWSIIGWIGLIGAIGLFAAGALGRLGSAAAFLGGGSALLLAGICLVAARLRPAHRAAARLSLAGLAMRNATRNRARSLLCVALIALASFTLVTVSSMESAAPQDTFDEKSGSGGYALIVRTDIPLLGDLNTFEGRQLLMRLPSARDPRWALADFAMMRSWAGQDISCLNVTQPHQPTILAVPPSMIREDRFTFASMVKKTDNPWELLNGPQDDPNTIPVIADSESAEYILKLKLGETLPINDAAGRARKLKLVATLAGSIFQSEMLMSEANFLKLFPGQSGYSMVLARVKPGAGPRGRAENVASVRRLLSETLNDSSNEEKSDYSASIQTTAARLAAYHEVANTYLATFRALGSLGLMLGTIGLAVVLVRNLLERRAELALLAAIGFTRRARAGLVFRENMSLLLIGLLVGAGSAMAGVIPNLMTSAHRLNVPALAIALAAVVVIGAASLLVAVRLMSGRITPASLRAE